jgi:hypothetical protein
MKTEIIAAVEGFSTEIVAEITENVMVLNGQVSSLNMML